MATRMYVCESGEHSSTLLSSLNEQRLKGLLCDVAIRVQDHIFKAHVNVLASTMGYFRDLYLKTGKERPDGVVEIPIIVNSTGFAKILDFIYTSQLCLSQSTVMQVLCSACYLQIPYVVEKCQEFIATHGHVTSPNSMADVTGPLLQNIQQRSTPNNASFAHQKNKVSSTLLAQLNRLSECATNRAATSQLKSNAAASPRTLQDSEQQDSVHLYTSPSPGERSSGIPDGHQEGNSSCDLNDEPLKPSNMITLKRERDETSTFAGENQTLVSYSPNNRFSLEQNEADDGPVSKKLAFLNDGSQPIDLANPRDDIDHKSLDDYFSTEREKQSSHVPTDTVSLLYSYHRSCQQNGRAKPGQIALASTTKKWLLDNGNPVKKDKPKKEYRCEYCDKMFGRQQHLKRHILTHTGERPYPCTYCDKRFRRSEHLKHHLASHEGKMANGMSTTRKKQRKSTKFEDAYALSKMMLDRMSHPEIAMGLYPAAPVVLPSMFVDAELKQCRSPLASRITEIDEPVQLNSTNDVNGGQYEATATEQEDDDQALNLCTISPKVENFDSATTTPALEKSEEENQEGNSDEGSGDQNSVESGSLDNNVNGYYDENPSESDIIAAEGSEVLTSDLKQLIAAMDE